MIPIGFTARPDLNSFHRKTELGKESVHLAFPEYEISFFASVDIGIRFDAVEDVLNSGDRGLTKKRKAVTFTIGTNLGYESELVAMTHSPIPTDRHERGRLPRAWPTRAL